MYIFFSKRVSMVNGKVRNIAKCCIILWNVSDIFRVPSIGQCEAINELHVGLQNMNEQKLLQTDFQLKSC